MKNLTSLRQPSIPRCVLRSAPRRILRHRRAGWAPSAPISSRRCSAFAKRWRTIRKLHGKAIDNHSANEAINHGFALVTEERSTGFMHTYLDAVSTRDLQYPQL